MSLKRLIKKWTSISTAVYWPPSGINNYGEATFGTAVQVPCRWENIGIDFVDREGKIQTASHKVWLNYPVAFGGMLWQGTLATVVDAIIPTNNPGALEIRTLTQLPTLHGDTIFQFVLM